MAREDQNEQVPFFSPATAPTQDVVTEKDEDDYGTLKALKKIFDDGIEGLSKDFNAFDLSKDSSVSIEGQIAGRQIAYDILVPLQGMVDSAIKAVEDGRKQV